MVGKEMMVKIALTEANIEGESTIFDAIDLCDSSAKADGICELSPIPKCTRISESEVWLNFPKQVSLSLFCNL